MLKKMGWQEQKGLGKHKNGPLQPLKTQLKRDRKGLGKGKKLEKRVTHFLAFHEELEGVGEGGYSRAGVETGEGGGGEKGREGGGEGGGKEA